MPYAYTHESLALTPSKLLKMLSNPDTKIYIYIKRLDLQNVFQTTQVYSPSTRCLLDEHIAFSKHMLMATMNECVPTNLFGNCGHQHQ